MLSLHDVLSRNPAKKAVINAAINKVGITNVGYVCSMGANAGFPGFIYDQDTVKFFRRHRPAIRAIINEIANAKKIDPVLLLCDEMGGKWATREAQKANVGTCIGIGKMPEEPITYVENFLAVYALQEVCKLFFPDNYQINHVNFKMPD